MIDIDKLIYSAEINAFSKIQKNESAAEDFVNIFWSLIEKVYVETYGYIKKKIKDIDFKPLDIKELLYDTGDEGRIKKYFKAFQESKGRIHFLSQLDLIFKTEAYMVCNNIFMKSAEFIETELTDERHLVRVKLYVADDSECGEHDGEMYWREVEIMCGHPGCDCQVTDIEVEIQELEDGFLPDLEVNE